MTCWNRWTATDGCSSLRLRWSTNCGTAARNLWKIPPVQSGNRTSRRSILPCFIQSHISRTSSFTQVPTLSNIGYCHCGVALLQSIGSISQRPRQPPSKPPRAIRTHSTPYRLWYRARSPTSSSATLEPSSITRSHRGTQGSRRWSSYSGRCLSAMPPSCLPTWSASMARGSDTSRTRRSHRPRASLAGSRLPTRVRGCPSGAACARGSVSDRASGAGLRGQLRFALAVKTAASIAARLAALGAAETASALVRPRHYLRTWSTAGISRSLGGLFVWRVSGSTGGGLRACSMMASWGVTRTNCRRHWTSCVMYLFSTATPSVLDLNMTSFGSVDRDFIVLCGFATRRSANIEYTSIDLASISVAHA